MSEKEHRSNDRRPDPDDRGYGPIEEEDIEDEPVVQTETDLPDPDDEKGDVDPETRRRLEEAAAEARRRRERAEEGHAKR